MVDSVVGAYKEISKLSDIKGARILKVKDDDVLVQVNWNARNLAALKRSGSCSNYLVHGAKEGEDKVTAFPPIPCNDNVVLSQSSPSGKRLASVLSSEKDKEAQYVMVVEEDGSAFTIDLKTAKKHGKVYSDPEFSCLEWSPDETKIAYVAEKKRAKPANFLAPMESDGEDVRGQEFLYRNDWGEQLEGQVQSVVCVLTLATEVLECYEMEDGLCPGQLIWGPGGQGLFGIAFVAKPYRLGIVYCPNRETKLFYLDPSGKFCVISEGLSNIRTPRLSPDGSKISFLRSQVGGPHAKSAQLCLMSWPEKQEKIVVDVVHREEKIVEGYTFHGIYGYSGLPRRCWLEDSRRLVLSSYNHHDIATYVVNVENGDITELRQLGSVTALDVHRDRLLVDNAMLTSPGRVLLGMLPAEGSESTLKNNFVQVTPSRTVPGVENNYRSFWTFVNKEPHPDPKYNDVPISVLYYGPTSLREGESKRPLICWPHGGPHSTSANVFYPQVSLFVHLGYSVLFPNYRGSLGFGEDGVNALPGHCGLTDVSDCHQAVLSCLDRFKDVVDESQIFLCGGSHGGFLVTHLAAQYPDIYKAVSSRNPVTDIPAMANVTDIPDWTFVEAGFEYKIGKTPDGATLARMHEMSPISRIDAVRAPTLLLVGRNDARVPPSQGINYHKMLLARGVDTKLLLYDDCHPLSKMDVEVDWLINTALWFEKYKK